MHSGRGKQQGKQKKKKYSTVPCTEKECALSNTHKNDFLCKDKTMFVHEDSLPIDQLQKGMKADIGITLDLSHLR